jgi:hypothetical protein
MERVQNPCVPLFRTVAPKHLFTGSTTTDVLIALTKALANADLGGDFGQLRLLMEMTSSSSNRLD